MLCKIYSVFILKENLLKIHFGVRVGYCANDAVLELAHQLKTNRADTTSMIINMKSTFDNVSRNTGLRKILGAFRRPPWKQSNYLRGVRSDKALQKLKSSLHVASRNEWQSDYDTPGETSHYYSIVKKELYGGKYPNPLKSFMSSVSRHTFSKLFQLRTGHGVLGKYFRTRGIDERDHNCECGQLETVEHVLKECPLHPAARDLLGKVPPELDPKILLDTKKGLGAVVKFLDSLPQLLC